PHMLPDPETLARQIGALGIGNAHRVVVYDASGVNLSAPRVWWTLKVAGHDSVSVLDGGFGRWRAEGRPIEQVWRWRAPAHFTIRFRPELVTSIAELQAALGS